MPKLFTILFCGGRSHIGLAENHTPGGTTVGLDDLFQLANAGTRTNT